MLNQKKILAYILPNGIVPGQNLNTIKTEGLKLSVSICYYINKKYVGLDADKQNDPDHNYAKFYEDLRKLQTAPTVTINNVAQAIDKIQAYPFKAFDNQVPDKDSIKYTDIKALLWDAIFPDEITNNEGLKVKVSLNAKSSIKNFEVGKISNLNDHFHHLNRLESFDKSYTHEGNNEKPHASSVLQKIQDYGVALTRTAYAENIAFLKSTPHGKKFSADWLAKIENYHAEANYIKAKKAQSSITAQEEKDVKVRTTALVENLSGFYKELLSAKEAMVTSYSKSGVIDIDEIRNSFAAITNETSLMRLMGLIQDYTITLKVFDGNQWLYEHDLNFVINSYANKFVLPVAAKLKLVEQDGKLALLIKDSVVNVEVKDNSAPPKNIIAPATFYNNSILRRSIIIDGKEGLSKLIRVDKMALETKYKVLQDKENNGETACDKEVGDGLTRGILFTNPWLHHIISPPDDFDENMAVNGVTDDYIIRGHRIALIKSNGKGEKNSFYSLTRRDIEIKVENRSRPIFKSTQFEGCINFDTPSQYMQDGEIRSVTSDVLFEYSGELLSLKSAFTPVTRTSDYEYKLNQIKYTHDSGMFKSQKRFTLPMKVLDVTYDEAISFFHFPFTRINKKSTYLSVSYDIPSAFATGDSKNSKAPQLRFGNEYTCVVYQEYLNGWGLPLLPDNQNTIQLSLQEIIEKDADAQTFTPKRIKFAPLENKRALQLVHRREFKDDPDLPVSERPSLEHLVVRSDSGDDRKQIIEERHILPPKIELETAFWHDLLSPPNLTPQQSYNIRLCSTCSFADEEDYDKYIAQGKKCPAACTRYCGGTHMKSFYPQKQIKPPHLTDPMIRGFDIRLFWNKECTAEYEVREAGTEKIEFKGVPGIGPLSYLLIAGGAKTESFIKNYPSDSELNIFLKKGMHVYAQLTNTLETEKYGDWENKGWWEDLSKSLAKSATCNTVRNAPKILALTHAVKEPLFAPVIIRLASSPNETNKIEHIDQWLKKEAYAGYKKDINIIASRTVKDDIWPAPPRPRDSAWGASLVNIELCAHFERLDAIRKIKFLKDIIPTGALELWMRKEVFIDDPDQIVLNPRFSKNEVNHLPDEPVVPFSSDKNKFALDYKIEFDNDIIDQMKSLTHVEDIDSINDVFRSLITRLNFKHDFKTTHFEEREYYLKNISKFKGYFSSQEFVDDTNSTALQKLEEYVLPKLAMVTKDLEKDSIFRFKIMALNNLPPAKPDVSYANTTIQENRLYPNRNKTYVTQRGNIVTIYLKRGRLTSGKDERVGIIIDGVGLYKDYYRQNKLISKVGRDILTDENNTRTQYLQYGDIIKPEQDNYEVGFEDELGLYHFLPRFDVEKQLWKFEVELDIKTADGRPLHNPFINFCLVHFQPFSINYNDSPANADTIDLRKDCRISDVANYIWCYLLPERKLAASFSKPTYFNSSGSVDLTLTYDYESLHHFNKDKDNKLIRTNFIVTIQGSNGGGFWTAVKSNMASDYAFHHSLLSPEILKANENLVRVKIDFERWVDTSHQAADSFRYFRVRLVEVEWFNEQTWEQLISANKDLLSDIEVNEDLRLRYVELIY